MQALLQKELALPSAQLLAGVGPSRLCPRVYLILVLVTAWLMRDATETAVYLIPCGYAMLNQADPATHCRKERTGLRSWMRGWRSAGASAMLTGTAEMTQRPAASDVMRRLSPMSQSRLQLKKLMESAGRQGEGMLASSA